MEAQGASWTPVALMPRGTHGRISLKRSNCARCTPEAEMQVRCMHGKHMGDCMHAETCQSPEAASMAEMRGDGEAAVA